MLDSTDHAARPDPTERPVTIRDAEPADRERLHELEELDCCHLADEALLVAEVEGDVWAAIGLESGAVFADPFRPTADLVALLRVRAAQAHAGPAGGADGRGALARLLPRLG